MTFAKTEAFGGQMKKYIDSFMRYRFLLKELKGIEISGATILRLSKTDHCYEEYSLDFEDKTHLEFIVNCEQLFLTLVAAYKMRLYCYNQYHHIYGLESWRKKK